MLTPEQWLEHDRRLQERRRSRREGTQAQMGVWPTPDDTGFGVTPIEIAPGRGDLSFTSGFAPTIPSALQLVGPYVVSFARIFMSQPWVASAVMRLLGWTVRVPLFLFRKDPSDVNNKIRVGRGEHPLADAISQPWDRANQIDLILAILGPVLVHGNSTLQVQSGAGNAVRFVPKDWRFQRPIMPFRDELDGFAFDVDNPAHMERVPIEEVLHTRWWSPIWPIGCSPLQQLGVTIQVEDAAQRYQRAIFNNGARTSGVATMTEEFLGQDFNLRQRIMAQVRADLNALYVGPENSGRPMLLPPGLDWKPAQQTAVEVALIDQRKITREEIAAVYQIPPPLMGILDRATYSNIETQRDMTYTDIVGPLAVLIEQTINAQVIEGLLQDDTVYVQFDFGAVLRGDRLQEIDALRDGIASAMFTPNEARGVLGYPRVAEDGMDEFYLPLVNTLQPVGAPSISIPNQPPLDVPPDLPGRKGQRGNGNGNGNGYHARTRALEVVRGYRQRD